MPLTIKAFNYRCVLCKAIHSTRFAHVAQNALCTQCRRLIEALKELSCYVQNGGN